MVTGFGLHNRLIKGVWSCFTLFTLRAFRSFEAPFTHCILVSNLATHWFLTNAIAHTKIIQRLLQGFSILYSSILHVRGLI